MSEPENYVKKRGAARIHKTAQEKKYRRHTGNTVCGESEYADAVCSYCCSTCGDSDRNHCTAYAGRSSLPDRIIRDWNCLLPA